MISSCMIAFTWCIIDFYLYLSNISPHLFSYISGSRLCLSVSVHSQRYRGDHPHSSTSHERVGQRPLDRINHGNTPAHISECLVRAMVGGWMGCIAPVIPCLSRNLVYQEDMMYLPGFLHAQEWQSHVDAIFPLQGPSNTPYDPHAVWRWQWHRGWGRRSIFSPLWARVLSVSRTRDHSVEGSGPSRWGQDFWDPLYSRSPWGHYLYCGLYLSFGCQMLYFWSQKYQKLRWAKNSLMLALLICFLFSSRERQFRPPNPHFTYLIYQIHMSENPLLSALFLYRWASHLCVRDSTEKILFLDSYPRRDMVLHNQMRVSRSMYIIIPLGVSGGGIFLVEIFTHIAHSRYVRYGVYFVRGSSSRDPDSMGRTRHSSHERDHG